MSDPLSAELAERCRGTVTADAPLAGFTTLRVGGPARALVVAEHDADLAVVGEVAARYRVPVTVIGRGSNLLISDDGWPGVALQLGRAFRGVALSPPSVRLGAAEPLPAAATALAAAGLAGFTWAIAVPGTVGGAVRMNAGAHGGELVDHLREIELVRLGDGGREVWPAHALGLAYRHSELPDDAVVVAATLDLPPGDPEELRAELARIRAWRRAHQPLNEPNCGSVFTNPPGDSAGRLIEVAGCKGLRVGGAEVSQRHANFIVTRTGARAADVAALIETVIERVHAHAGVTLRPEVRRLGAGVQRDVGTGPR